MASKAVTDAVLARIAANWTHISVVEPNGDPNPPTDGFLSIEFPIATEEQISIGDPGNNVFREEGVIRFVMAVPIGGGLSPYDAYFDELRALFRSRVFGGVTTWGVSPTTTDDRSDQGSFFRLSCAVPYQFDILA